MNAKALHEKMNEITKRINDKGCRVVYPFSVPSPIKIMFGGTFKNAEWFTAYPATFHIYGETGQVALTDIQCVEQIARDKYVITHGRDYTKTDILLTIET